MFSCLLTRSHNHPWLKFTCLQQCSLTNYKTSAIMSSGQTRKWSSLTKMKSLMKTKQSTSAQKTLTYCRAQWWKFMISACFAAMNSSVFQTILKSNVQTSVWQQKIGPYYFNLLLLKVVLKVIKWWDILLWKSLVFYRAVNAKKASDNHTDLSTQVAVLTSSFLTNKESKVLRTNVAFGVTSNETIKETGP